MFKNIVILKIRKFKLIGGRFVKPSKFETYLLDEEFDFERINDKIPDELKPYEMEQYPDGFFTEL